MAVPGRRNGLMEDDENEDDQNYALFEQEGLLEPDSYTPPHLRNLSIAVQDGDVDALRLALGLSLPLSLSSKLGCSHGYVGWLRFFGLSTSWVLFFQLVFFNC